MNFQQLRIIREAARHDFNLTEVANVLFTSQSGVSKHIKDLEGELGVELFFRKGKRLLGATDAGKELVVVAERMLLDAANIKRLGEQYARRDIGHLTVVTTHTQARYALPQVVTEFKRAYPKVHLKLHQGSPDEIVQMLLDGTADIGIASEALARVADLATFPYYSWYHSIIVPVGHPLEKVKPLTLKAVAEWPLITYHEGFTGRSSIDRAFDSAGLEMNIAMSAMDADVIKTYVEMGLGIGVIAPMAFNPERESGLRLLDSIQLFPTTTTNIAVRCGHYLRGFAYRFIEMCSPELTEARVREGVSPQGNGSLEL